ncbi:MAG: N-acetyl-gamma-glutamyl-phosphate reductase [Oscillospiraceae bacterium]
MIKVFIDGAEGTTGLRLADRLGARADVELLAINPELRKDAGERAKLSNSADVVFLCLPDTAAREAVAGITNPDTVVIDASTAHRTLDSWAYGLPELSSAHRAKIVGAKRIAVPGCHASGFTALAYPLVAGGLVAPNHPFSAHSVTGYSGGGKKMIAEYEDSERDPSLYSPRQYALGQSHKHLPEMQKIAGLSMPPVFNPILADFYAGMMVTVPLHTRLLRNKLDAEKLHFFFEDHYSGQRLVRVMPFGAEQQLHGGMIDAGALMGKDYMEVYVCGHEEQVVLIARFDNLGKGASGAAVQCMNIACGLDETTGLEI